jgi:hypothetical protein
LVEQVEDIFYFSPPGKHVLLMVEVEVEVA